jgi:hypothetical protein
VRGLGLFVVVVGSWVLDDDAIGVVGREWVVMG